MYLYRVELGMPNVLDETEQMVLRHSKRFGEEEFSGLMKFVVERTYQECYRFDYLLFRKLIWDLGFEEVEYVSEVRVGIECSSPITGLQ